MPAKTHRQIACYVTPEQHEALKRLSARTRIGIASFLREAVEHLLARHGVSTQAPKPEAAPQPAPAPKPEPAPLLSLRTEPHAAYSFIEAQARAEHRKAQRREARTAVDCMTPEQQRRRFAELHPDKLGRAYTPAELEEYNLLQAVVRRTPRPR